MPTPTNSVVFDVHDAKVWPMTNDSGTAPTYGAPVDVPGIADVSMDPNLQTSELKGDAQIIAKKGRLDKFNMSSTYGKLSIDVLKAIIGGEASTLDDVQDYRYKGGTALPYFGYGVNLLDVEPGLGSIQVIIFKAQVTGGTLLAQSSDNFGQPTFDVEGISLGCPAPSDWEGVMMAMRFFPEVVQLPTDPSEWSVTAAGPATGATAGTPGVWTPTGATAPADAAAAMTAAIVADPTTPWTTGQYVQGTTAGVGGEMWWDGDSWNAGRGT